MSKNNDKDFGFSVSTLISRLDYTRFFLSILLFKNNYKHLLTAKKLSNQQLKLPKINIRRILTSLHKQHV